ncbi:hypothetical protein Godav_025829 [Gossypium davidsonii]|uniref:Uncharacterized protein n=1 Tax=Gossypium davidsonii TaxID=34287 RepID=A0A7J8THW5_GOSDV|nr:hypothetical protein [Gossypium davidsonii]
MEDGFLDKVEEDNTAVQTWFEMTQREKGIVWLKDMYQSCGTSLVLV